MNRFAGVLCGALLLVTATAGAQTSTESGLAPGLARGGAASYYYTAKPGELTMQVNLWGAVKNPGRYEVSSATDLVQLLSFAGGPLEAATLGSVTITRIQRREGLPARRELVTLDLEELHLVEPAMLALQPGDTIFIEYSGWETLRDVFLVIGVMATVTAAVTGVIRVTQ